MYVAVLNIGAPARAPFLIGGLVEGMNVQRYIYAYGGH